MNKKSTKALASATLMSLVLTTALTAGPVKAAAGSATRVSGSDRYETAANVATTNWTTSDNVVLVSGQGYADAVSASALAKQLNAPILLTTPGTLSSTTQAALTKLQAKNIYVVGGNASVSQSIRDTLKKSYTLTELSGATRYETNVAVANELVKLGVKKDNVLVVGGTGFSDALSVAPIASAKGEILLLANNNQSDTQKAIDFAKGSNVTVVGTSNVISDSIKNAFSTTATRVDGGADRFATNLNVLNNFKSDLKADKLYVANASGNGYADALVASAIAGKTASPLVLVDTDSSDATTKALDYIKGEATKATDLEVVGGTGVVSDALLTRVTETVTPKTTNAQVQSVTTNGLAQIKVKYNQKVDEDTAKDVSNYKVDGSQLDTTKAYASLQSDGETVVINLASHRDQYKEVDVTVKKGVLSEDKSQTIPEYTQSVTFSDTDVPTVQSVTARGTDKITVQFSEPVNIGTADKLPAAIDDGDAKISNESTFLSKFKIDGQSISNFGLNSDYTLAKHTVKDSNNNLYSDQIEFYFDTALTSGSKTLKITDGDQDGVLSDAAKFPFKETSTNFNVDTLTTKPQIVSMTASDNKVYINFDRPMDSDTAQKAGYYEVNGTAATKAELKKDDTQVKLTAGKLNKGSNKVYVSDSVRDAYGNKVANDTNKSVDLDQDDTKPAVNSVSVLNDSTIRVRFSKDVDAIYATDESNYKLKDNDGTDISNYIKTATSATDYQDGKVKSITIPGNTKVAANGDTTDVVDIHLSENGADKYKLTEAKYTLTIKNIQDTASTPNVMKDYVTTFEGSNNIAPEVDGKAIAIKDATFDSSNPYRKVVVNFNKAMDSSSLTNTDNYKFKNENGTVKLPSGTTIDISSDSKSATIKFPSSYGTVDKTGDNLVKSIAVIGVKDENGNALEVSQTADVNTEFKADAITKIKPNSINVKYNVDDLNVNLSFDKSIDNLHASDFLVAGQVPTSGHKNADGSLTLVFKDGEASITAIKLAGLGAKVTTVAQGSIQTTDVNGAPIIAMVDADNNTPYGFTPAPKTYDTKNWTANADTKTVEVKFDTPIDSSSVKKDDFTFAIGGTTLKATTAAVKTTAGETNTIVFTFDSSNNSATALDKFVKDATMQVTPKDTTKISTVEDKNDAYGYYVPSEDDKDGYSITIGMVK